MSTIASIPVQPGRTDSSPPAGGMNRADRRAAGDYAPIHPFTRADAAHDNPDVGWFDNHNRERTDDLAEDWLIDGLVPVGAMVMYADPGAGKSMVVQQIIHHLAYGRPLGPWGAAQAGGHFVRVFDLESDARMSRERSYSITPWGDLPEDGNADRRDNFAYYSSRVIPESESEAWAVVQSQPERHATYLEQELCQAEAAGHPLRMVVIDTLTKFTGPKPQRANGNSYEYEAAIIDRLNRMALDHKCSIVIIHHTNKAGEISGSQGIGGSATVTCKLKIEDRTEEDLEQGVPASGVLVSTKVRIGGAFCYQVEQRSDGVWEFVDKPAPEAEVRGNARIVLAALADGPKTKAQLTSCGLAKSLRTTLTRMRAAGQIFSKYGQWHAVKDDRRTVPGQADGTCSVCGGPMTKIFEFQTAHPGCGPDGDPGPSGPGPEPEPDGGDDLSDVPAGAEPGCGVPPEPDVPQSPLAGFGALSTGDDLSDVPEEQQVSGFKALEASIGSSRMKPVLRIGGDARDEAPWSLITGRMTGEHRWARHLEIAPESRVLVLDRNGSYPSAMGSARVVPNILSHTGALAALPEKTAGIFLIAPVEWPESGIGHPLGKIADQAGPVWLTTQHLMLLERLASDGRIVAPEILDSWTGRSVESLFRKFSDQVQADRTSAQEGIAAGIDGAEDRYADVKLKSSVAIRGLWPKGSRSPFWRPDWSVSVRAEAAVRHWIRADQAMTGGAVLLKLGAVDEVAILADTVPDPYVLGTGYGKVKIKAELSYGEWVAVRGNRAR